MQPKIVIRKGPSDKLKNHTPSSGEPLYVMDTNQLRIGDGETPGGLLVAGSILIVRKREFLPYPPVGFKRWLIEKLGGLPEYNLAYCVDTSLLHAWLPKERKWEWVSDEQLLVVENLESAFNSRGFITGINNRRTGKTN